MPVGIIEVDQVDGRDAGVVERKVIVEDFPSDPGLESACLELPGDGPDFMNKIGSQVQAVGLLVDLSAFCRRSCPGRFLRRTGFPARLDTST